MTTNAHTINRETADRIYVNLLNALEDGGDDEVDARDMFTGVAEFVATFIRYIEEQGLGDRTEWRATFSEMLEDLL